MSKDGLPVKKPKGKSVVPVEIIAEETRAAGKGLSKLEESFDIDRVEKELRELDKESSFLDLLFKSSDERTLEQLKLKKEIAGARHNLRQNIIDIEKQRITARSSLLELRAELLEKEVMRHKDVQKTLLEIKLTELNIKKLRIELEELDLKQEKKERDKALKDSGKSPSEGRYDMKPFEALLESPDDKEGDEEG